MLLYAFVLLAINSVALFLVPIGLPGTWIMVAATAGVAWIQEGMFSPWTLAVLVVIALGGEILEFIAGAAGSKKAGGTWRGGVGAILGGLVGGIAGTFLIPVPILGSILGAALGAAGGALLGELSGGKKLEAATAVGRGAFVGRLLGTVFKLGAGVGIWVVAVAASFID